MAEPVASLVSQVMSQDSQKGYVESMLKLHYEYIGYHDLYAVDFKVEDFVVEIEGKFYTLTEKGETDA